MEPLKVSPTLLAVSDLLVLTALERAWSRSVPRSQRVNMRAADRHRGYVMVPIRATRPGQTDQQVLDKALTDAWVLCPTLVARNHLDVDPAAWAQLLDSYTRALLLMSQHHTPARLAPYLQPLVLPPYVDGEDDQDDEDDYEPAQPLVSVAQVS